MNSTDTLTSKSLKLMDQLDRIESILTVTAEMNGLDKAIAVTLSHVVNDLLPETQKIAFSLIENTENPNIEKSNPALTA